MQISLDNYNIAFCVHTDLIVITISSASHIVSGASLVLDMLVQFCSTMLAIIGMIVPIIFFPQIPQIFTILESSACFLFQPFESMGLAFF